MKTGKIVWFDGAEGLVVDETGKPHYMYKSALPALVSDPGSLANKEIRFSIYESAYSYQVDRVEFIPQN